MLKKIMLLLTMIGFYEEAFSLPESNENSIEETLEELDNQTSYAYLKYFLITELNVKVRDYLLKKNKDNPVNLGLIVLVSTAERILLNYLLMNQNYKDTREIVNKLHKKNASLQMPDLDKETFWHPLKAYLLSLPLAFTAELTTIIACTSSGASLSTAKNASDIARYLTYALLGYYMAQTHKKKCMDIAKSYSRGLGGVTMMANKKSDFESGQSSKKENVSEDDELENNENKAENAEISDSEDFI